MFVRKVRSNCSGADVGQALLRVLFRGVVHQHVELAKLLHRPLHQLLAEPLVADVARVREAAPAFRLDETLRLLRVAVLVQVGDRDVGAFAREQDGDCTPDAAIAAGDSRDLTLAVGPNPDAPLSPRPASASSRSRDPAAGSASAAVASASVVPGSSTHLRASGTEFRRAERVSLLPEACWPMRNFSTRRVTIRFASVPSPDLKAPCVAMTGPCCPATAALSKRGIMGKRPSPPTSSRSGISILCLSCRYFFTCAHTSPGVSPSITVLSFDHTQLPDRYSVRHDSASCSIASRSQ